MPAKDQVKSPGANNTTGGGGATVDPDSFRSTLGNFPTGVVAITAMDGDRPVGMTIGSFFSVSLNPVLVGFCVGEESSTWPRIESSGRLCVNILADDQVGVAYALARPGVREKFADTAWEQSDHGLPIVAGAIAWIECETTATYPAGDHIVVIGAVRDVTVLRDQGPLVHFRRSFHSLALNGSAP